MKTGYDLLAAYYDRLSRLVYGQAIVKAHLFLIDHIPANSSVLIVGGGTGFVLEEISYRHAHGLHITYVENSVAMLALSKKRNTGKNIITFINQSVVEVSLPETFDIIITPFMLDNFSSSTAAAVFEKLHTRLVPGGLWLFADFAIDIKNSWWQKPLLKTMYLFFRCVCGIEAAGLPDTASLFTKYNYIRIASKMFFKRFILADVYKRCE